MTEELDFALLGKELIQPSTGETCDPEKKLKGKVVLLYFGAHWSEGACLDYVQVVLRWIYRENDVFSPLSASSDISFLLTSFSIYLSFITTQPATNSQRNYTCFIN